MGGALVVVRAGLTHGNIHLTLSVLAVKLQRTSAHVSADLGVGNAARVGGALAGFGAGVAFRRVREAVPALPVVVDPALALARRVAVGVVDALLGLVAGVLLGDLGEAGALVAVVALVALADPAAGCRALGMVHALTVARAASVHRLDRVAQPLVAVVAVVAAAGVGGGVAGGVVDALHVAGAGVARRFNRQALGVRLVESWVTATQASGGTGTLRVHHALPLRLARLSRRDGCKDRQR